MSSEMDLSHGWMWARGREGGMGREDGGREGKGGMGGGERCREEGGERGREREEVCTKDIAWKEGGPGYTRLGVCM